MAIAKKRKRKITINDRDFYWSVKPDDDDFGLLHLFIASDDKKFIVSYPLANKNPESGVSCMQSNPYIIVMGKEFKGLDNLGHGWERFAVPKWDDEAVTPSLVADIINWCLTIEKVTPVDWSGNKLER